MKAQRLFLATSSAALVVFIALPLLALVLATAPGKVTAGLRDPLVGPALRLSLATTAISLVIILVLGTPLAWLLARSRGPGARALEISLQLPIVMPPAVAGVALLLAFGRRGMLASWFSVEDWAVSFTSAAVVMAQVFVSAPFFVQAAVSAFRRVDESLLVVARSLGASPFVVLRRVALPLAAPGLLAGAALSWARALGEFGATLMFAGNLMGVTQTLPLAIYMALEGDLATAQALSLLLMGVAFALLVAARALLARSLEAGRGSGKGGSA